MSTDTENRSCAEGLDKPADTLCQQDIYRSNCAVEVPLLERHDGVCYNKYNQKDCSMIT